MSTSAFHPYRSVADRDSYFAYYDARAARVWPLVSEERTVPTSYGPTFVRISGPADAPPLVLLPGATGTSLMWAPNIRNLSNAYRTFAVDQIGDAGRSICTRPPRCTEDLAAWLDELLDGLGLARVNVAGMSYGGWLTAEYALRRPERVIKAVLLAPGATVSRISPWFLVRIGTIMLSRGGALQRVLGWIFADTAREYHAHFEDIVDHSVHAGRALRWRIPMPKAWKDEQWRSLRVPALYVVGEHEVIYSAEKAVRRLQRLAPHVRTELVRGAGHDLTIVQQEMVDRIVLEFLGTTPAGTEAPAAGRL